MTYIEMLCEGVKTIAENHGADYCTKDWDIDGDVCVWSSNGTNVPTNTDISLLAQELNLDDDCVISSSFGIDIEITDEWINQYGYKEFVPNPAVNGMWCRADQFTDIFKRELEL